MKSENTKKRGASKDPLLSILVPVYNEETTILEILKKVTSLPIDNYEVLVVDDASLDNSSNIINDFKQNFKNINVLLKVYIHEKNRGKGAGIQTGLAEARGKYFVIQDADLEYDPNDIPTLLAKATEDNAIAVYGSRFLGDIKSMPKPNYYANRFYNFLLRRLYNTTITDMHTCYKMVDTKTLRRLGIVSNGFNYAPELISKLLLNGISVQEVPIKFNGRTKKEGKKIGVKDGIECTYLLLKYRLRNT